MNCYILHIALFVMILLFIIAIICYPYAKYISKLKQTYWRTKNVKIENNVLKIVRIIISMT